MKEKVRTPGDKKKEFWAGVIIISIGTAFSFAFVGGILATYAGPFLVGVLGFRIVWWHGVLVAGSIGLVTGAIRAVLEFQRYEKLEQKSEAIGLKTLADDDASKVGSEISQMLNRECDLIGGSFMSLDGMHLVVADLRIEPPRSSTKPQSNQSSPPDEIQTCVYFQFRDFHIPSFELEPEGIMSRIFGGQDIDFDDSPLFSKKYHLMAEARESGAELFSKPVRDHFEQNLGLKVIGKEQQILFFRPKQCCAPDQLDVFVELAIQSIDLLQENAVSIEAQPKPVPAVPQSKAEALEQLKNVDGIMGTLVRHQIKTTMVDDEELDEFLQQSVPRSIPRPLRKRFGYSLFLLLVATLLLLGASIFLSIAIFTAEMKGPERGIGSALSLAVGGVGALIAIFSWYFRRKKMRVLKYGEVIHGIVQSIGESGWVLGNEHVYEAKFLAKGSDVPISTYFRGCNIQRAENLAKSGETTRLLRDPENPDNTLLIECYSI